MSGLGFSLQKRPDNKRPLAGAKIAMPKKPANVSDMFGAVGSDDEGAEGHTKKARKESASASADQLGARLDAEVVGVATKLADFVAKNGHQYEDMTRERNPGESPFKFLHDKSSLGYQFYAAKLREFEATKGPNPPLPPPAAPSSNNRGPGQPSTSAPGASYPRQQPPTSSHPSSSLSPEAAAAVAAAAAAAVAAVARARAQQPPLLPSHPQPHRGSPAPQLAPQPPTAEQIAEQRRRAQIALAKGDSLAAMEAFAALAAKRDGVRSCSADPEDPDGGGGGGTDDDDDDARRRRAEPLLNKTAFERRRVTAVFKDDGSRGHHMQDYIPKEVLAEFMAKGGDKMAAVQAEQLANKNAIGADNIGHKLLQKMGWKEGEGLGGTQKGITAPIRPSAAAAAAAPGEARGLGAAAHGEASTEDDMFEAYRKRMMLGYKYRPNPLGNPRRAYY